MGRDAESGAGTGERPRPGGPSQSPAAGDRAGTHRAYGAECDGDGAAGRAGGRAGGGEKTRGVEQKRGGEVGGGRGRWAEMQNRALELANVPDRGDHRSHQRKGIEQEPTVHMGPSATAMERRAEQVAAREGRAYEPVTAVGQHNAGVVERAGLRQYIERGTEWLRDMGQRIAGRLHDVAASLSGAVERDRREAAEVQLAREAQERLAADRAR